MEDAVIVAACRTPIGKFQGALKSVTAPQLGSLVIREAMKRASLSPADVQEVIMGNVLTGNLGQAPARQAALGAGLPPSVAAFTINKVCGSGLKAVMLAAQAIRAGDAKIIVAGGQESMTNTPYLLPKARDGYRLGHGELLDSLLRDGLNDAYDGSHMGITGEIVSERYKIPRDVADKFSARSHQKAAAATREGKFNAEMVPVPIPQKDGTSLMVDRDEGVRDDSSEASLAKLRPAFRKDGLITAGNSSQISDGGSATIIMAASEAKRRGLTPLARIVAYTTAGVKPEWVMEAPIPGVRALLEKTGKTIDDVDLFEHNEAFAAASCAVMQELHVPADRFNVHGGAVAMGHPIGASGSRVLTTLLYALKDRKKDRGVATLCLGGGNAVSMMVERV